MAESSNFLLQFDTNLLDLNENAPPNTESSVFTHTVELLESVSPLTCPENERTITEDFNSSELLSNSLKKPEVCTKVKPTELDVLFQNTEVNSSNSDSGIHDSENNIVENTKLDFTRKQSFAENCGIIFSDFNSEENDVQFKDEEFHDAVQFFKDPSSLVILENAGATNIPTEPLMARSSLYVKFDPLHAKFFSQSTVTNEQEKPVENETDLEIIPDNLQNDVMPEIVNKHQSNFSPRQSFGNVLISFDSPVIDKNLETMQNAANNEKLCEQQKFYTEEELQQALKLKELTLQETFLKQQHDLEIARSQKQLELESKVEEQEKIINTMQKSYHCVLEEFFGVFVTLSDKEKTSCDKIEMAEKEISKLKEDLKISVEDLQNVEGTFSDFLKRYEQSKNMLKVFTQNEDKLKQQLDEMKLQLNEKEEMYKALQSRTEEMLDKANTEVANAKKAGDGQVAVLKAQLKKAELKISSLESDVKHVKIENGKLSSICDELMAKVSET